MADLESQLSRVDAFATRMKAKLTANSHKGDWRDCEGFTPPVALLRLEEEVAELRDALLAGADPDVIRDEAADVANFALFVTDLVSQGRHGASPY